MELTKQIIAERDSKNMYGSIVAVADQIAEARAVAKTYSVPSNFGHVKNIVCVGMGGSTLGSHVIKSVYRGALGVPVEIINDYHVPAYVGAESLVIGVSYSGSTAEPLAALAEAQNRGAKIAVVTSGSAMERWARQSKTHPFVFTTNNNPCGSPRMGTSYTLVGQLAVLQAAGLLQNIDTDLDQFTAAVRNSGTVYSVENTNNNLAKDIAAATIHKSVWYIAAEHLVGSAHIAANQMNENAKRFAGYFAIPELNHHLLEGLSHPMKNADQLLVVLFESKKYDKQIQARFSITKEILRKNNINFFSYEAAGDSALAEVGEVLSLSSHASFYSAILAGIDPTAIPVVDYFKEALKK